VKGLCANRRFHAITLEEVASIETCPAEGFYVVGYVEEFNKSREMHREVLPLSSTEAQIRVTTRYTPALSCYPLKLVSVGTLPETPSCFSADQAPHSIYFQLLVDREEVENIRGMSGGPVYAIWREQGRAKIALVGIQVAWDSDMRLLRAEKIWAAFGLFAKWSDADPG
jgi:hypothetical protein